MATSTDNLGRHVLDRAAKRLGLLGIILEALFAQPEISQFNMPIRTEQNVFRFQIAIDNAQRMQVGQGTRKLGQVELDVFLGEHVLAT